MVAKKNRTAQKKRPDIYARFTAALPAARRVIAYGGVAGTSPDFYDNVSAPFPKAVTDKQLDQIVKLTDAAYALGVAVGMLLSIDALTPTKGGR